MPCKIAMKAVRSKSWIKLQMSANKMILALTNS